MVTGAEQAKHASSGPLSIVTRPLLCAAALGLGLALTGCSGFGGIGETQVHGVVVDDNLVASIKPGVTTQQEVAEQLGTPSTTSTLNGEAFFYVSQTTVRPVAFMSQQITDRRIFAVYFDQTGKVTKVANYGLKDGKVFDFISRQTPTSGSELSVLTQLQRGLLAGIPGLGG